MNVINIGLNWHHCVMLHVHTALLLWDELAFNFVQQNIQILSWFVCHQVGIV